MSRSPQYLPAYDLKVPFTTQNYCTNEKIFKLIFDIFIYNSQKNDDMD